MYALATLIITVIMFIADMMSKKRLFKQRRFWVFQTVVVSLTVLVDQFSSEVVVFYNESILIGPRIGSVPVENLLFGFALMYLNVLFFELLKTRHN